MRPEERDRAAQGAPRLEPDDERWLVPLPARAGPPLEVFVSGVPQSEGRDYALERRGARQVLAFRRPLQKEGQLGFWRWVLMFFSIAGTYRRDDSVDVRYTAGGEARVATGLEIVPPKAAAGPPPRGGGHAGPGPPGDP